MSIKVRQGETLRAPPLTCAGFISAANPKRGGRVGGEGPCDAGDSGAVTSCCVLHCESRYIMA